MSFPRSADPIVFCSCSYHLHSLYFQFHTSSDVSMNTHQYGGKTAHGNLDFYYSPDGFVCSYCSKCIAAKSVFERHLLTHTGEKPFQCPVCPQRFGIYASLKTHVRFKHPGMIVPKSYKDFEKQYQGNI